MAKNIGFGSVCTCTSSTGTVELAQLRNISGPNSDYNDIDTTCMDSSTNFRTFVPGVADPGTLTLQHVADSTMRFSGKLSDMHKTRTSQTFSLYIASSTGLGGSETFTAYVKSIGREIPLDDVVVRDVTLKVSGDPGWTT